MREWTHTMFGLANLTLSRLPGKGALTGECADQVGLVSMSRGDYLDCIMEDPGTVGSTIPQAGEPSLCESGEGGTSTCSFFILSLFLTLPLASYFKFLLLWLSQNDGLQPGTVS